MQRNPIEKVKNTDWYVIVNPNAGVRKGQRDWPKIKSLLDESGLSYESVITKHAGDAIELAMHSIVAGYRQILVVGGDGTLNEVINGIFLQESVPSNEVTIGMITVGTGNDWSRMYHIPHHYRQAIEVVSRGHTFLQDAGKVTYMDDKEPRERYFVNLAGMGFDAQVAKRTNQKKAEGKGGVAAYLVNLLRSLINYQPTIIHVDIDGKKISAPFFSMGVGIGKYNGGGMMQAPHAVADDGQLAITLIRKVSKLKVVRSIKLLYDGSFIKLPEVTTYFGKQIQVHGERDIMLEADGESLGTSPFTFSVIPGSIRVITAG
jgi:YegS/Rv2252/BmrU family lipid kinase